MCIGILIARVPQARSAVVPLLVLLLLTTERGPNGVSNYPSPEISVLWFNFSLEDDDLKIL